MILLEIAAILTIGGVDTAGKGPSNVRQVRNRILRSKGEHSELTSNDGSRMRCASADIEVDSNGALKPLGSNSQIGTKPLTPVIHGKETSTGMSLSHEELIKLNGTGGKRTVVTNLTKLDLTHSEN